MGFDVYNENFMLIDVIFIIEYYVFVEDFFELFVKNFNKFIDVIKE